MTSLPPFLTFQELFKVLSVAAAVLRPQQGGTDTVSVSPPAVAAYLAHSPVSALPKLISRFFQKNTESDTMEDSGGEAEEEMLNYINTSSHKRNLVAALDYHSVREPDLELVSVEGRKLYGHRSEPRFSNPPPRYDKDNFEKSHCRSVLGIFSPLLADICAGIPCCQKTSIMFPDTTSEVLSHLLNVLYTGKFIYPLSTRKNNFHF